MFAYLDPGSATFLWQLLLSAAGGFVLLLRWARERIDRGVAMRRLRRIGVALSLANLLFYPVFISFVF